MARIDAAPGATVEEVKRTRVLGPLDDKPGDGMDFWQYQEQITPQDWPNHIIYVYRWLENGEKEAVGKYAQVIDEFFLREKHGGGAYKLILKRGPQIWKTVERCRVEGPPKPFTATAEAAHSAAAVSSDGRSLDRLCDLLERVIMRNDSSSIQSDAMKAALQLQSEGFRSVVTNVRDVTQPATPPAAANPMDDLTRQFMAAAIQKMLNPADPIENFAKMAAAFKSLGLDTGGAKASVGAELVRTVGGAIPQIMDGIKSYTYAVGKQAELEILRITHGMRNPPAPPQAVPPQPGPATVQPPAAPTAPQQETQQVMTFDDVERRIAGFMMDTKLSATEAAESILDFVEDISPNQLYPYICKLSEVELTAFINSRPILSQVPKDPRFSEVVKKIVELSNPAPADSPNTSSQSPA